MGFLKGTGGVSASPLPFNLSVSVGVLDNFEDINSITGHNVQFETSAAFLGYAQSYWPGGGATLRAVTVSTDPLGASIGYDYNWFINGK